MTVAQQIRKAALGPVPAIPEILRSWVPDFDAWCRAIEFAPPGHGWAALEELSLDERRMFLLFVAEATQ